jgi:hypothetical protein
MGAWDGKQKDGLFSQSNFGIVTKLTMWLMPCPDYLQLIFYKLNSGRKFRGLWERSEMLGYEWFGKAGPHGIQWLRRSLL